MISVEQRFAVLAAMGANINWDALTPKQIQIGISEAQRAGDEATEFIRRGFSMSMGGNCFRPLENITFKIPALPRWSSKAIIEHFSWAKKPNPIERDISIITTATLELGTVLRENEPQINGAEYERRLGTDSYFGLQHAIWLVDHQKDQELQELKALVGKCYIDFPGMILVDANGDRFFPCLDSNDGDWCLLFIRVVSGLLEVVRVARPRK